ncbi:uncharacterized protein PFL1_05355 [Pseudozyma flocculosa PF-1]|uniref:RRM domain-containing protein n=2 Tax=Pseudozyma flocculosa TaxID=84751 RepID=A0A5C3FAA1_9BASI|nr:uncharacterized protein PFL1_05355 [Pseudozyma flocculosa PF-1]EPQ27071.1 hypothetical protein PFL1_05355 [Pseudozyma flocculosa PF-1]SPO41364.1 uncharacterized protein PSFLO_06846 [Pseudozyma flocculosa]
MGKKSQKKAQAATTSAAPSSSAATTTPANALFGAKPSGSFDAELDAFFKVAPASAPKPAAAAAPATASKRKASHVEASASAAKKAKSADETTDEDDGQAAEAASSEADEDEDEDADEGDGDLSELDEAEIESMADLMDADDSVEGAGGEAADMEGGDEEEDEEEDDEEDPDVDEDEDDDEEDAAKYGSTTKPKAAFAIVHESLQKKGAVRKPKNAQFEDVDEPSELKDKRTLFIGNVPIEAVKSKSLQRRLRRHLASLSPYPGVTKITSLRFRSIPFAVPTDDFTAESEEAAAKLAKRRERSKNYKEALAAVEGKDAASAHQFLTAKQKRKVAYINQDINSHADTVNAYVTLGYPDAVFRHINQTRRAKQQEREQAEEQEQADEQDAATTGKGDGEGSAKPKKGSTGSKEQRQPADELAGFDKRLTAPVLAALLASIADGQLFEGRHLRVDLVKPLEASEVIAAGLDKVTTAEGSLVGSAASGTTDPKRTLFVGNLDFEVKDEEIRTFFEKLLADERGPPPDTLIPVVGLDGKPPVQPTLYRSSAKAGGQGEGEDDDDDGAASSDDESDAEDERTAAAADRMLALHAASWVRSVRVIRDKATQMGKGIAYVRFLDTECVDEIMAIHEAEEAFFASVRGGGAKGAAGGKGGGGRNISNSALASTAIAVGGKQSEFRRRLKLRGRVLRVSRCKATTNATRNGPGGGNTRQGRTQRRDQATPSSDEPRTPARGSRPGYRSSGAPTPNGSSPKFGSDRPAQSRAASTSTTPTKKHGPASSSGGGAPAKPPPASAAALEKASMLAKLGKEERAAFKRNDAERQQRRMEKKNKKKAASKILKDAGSGRDKVKLPSSSSSSSKGGAAKGKGKKSFSGAGAQAKKAKAKASAAAGGGSGGKPKKVKK